MRMRVHYSPEERTMYMRVTCPVCEGKGTVPCWRASEPEGCTPHTCDACGGAGHTAPRPVQAWEYPKPGRAKRVWAWVRYQAAQHARPVLRGVLFLAAGVACGMLGGWLTHLLLMGLMW